MDENQQNTPVPEAAPSPEQPSVPASPEPAEGPNTRKWLIMGGVVLVTILAAGVGVLGYQNFQAGQQVVTPTPTTASELPPAPPPVPGEPTSAEAVNWKTETITFKRLASEMNTETILYINLEIPSQWTMKVVKKEAGCTTDYVISSDDQNTQLTISPICVGWAATYSTWPQDGVVINEQADAADDNSTSYRIRYYDVQNAQYKYVDALATPPLDKSKTQIMDAVTITHNPYQRHLFVTAFVKLNLSKPVSDKEQYLKITDKIAASMKLR